MDVRDHIQQFLDGAAGDVGTITNELALQCELACFLRMRGYHVQFEAAMNLSKAVESTRRPKKYLDLLVHGHGSITAIELKVPLQGRHPETLYDFCADIEFVESIVASGRASAGVVLLVTNDSVFWSDSGRGSEIHNLFRVPGSLVAGKIQKPTGDRSSCVTLRHSYDAVGGWATLRDRRLLASARYLLLHVRDELLS